VWDVVADVLQMVYAGRGSGRGECPEVIVRSGIALIVGIREAFLIIRLVAIVRQSVREPHVILSRIILLIGFATFLFCLLADLPNGHLLFHAVVDSDLGFLVGRFVDPLVFLRVRDLKFMESSLLGLVEVFGLSTV